MKIRPREQWGPSTRNGFGKRGRAETIHLHHSCTLTLDEDASEAQERLEMVKLESIGNKRGLGGVPYNRCIFPSGRVWVGVSIDRIGDHTRGHNKTGAGFVFMGNFQKRPPSKKAVAALKKCIRYEKAKGRIKSGAPVYGHFQTSATACPGAMVKPLLPEIRAAVVKPAVLVAKDTARYVYVSLVDPRSRLNLRKKPSGTVIAKLPHKTKLQLLSKGKQWSKVRYGRKVGYVATDKLTSR